MEAPSENGFYFYVLWCADQTLYTGYTVNLKQRVTRHNSGQGAKYTRVPKRRPVQLLYYESFENQHDAMSAEYFFKKQSRKEKLKYLKNNGVIVTTFSH
ncbi:GIY-YIG nuclease family protein [Pediococcus acidilactici]|uniref:GIY-YIG nuclease family protein n=1 Tax=Pediococcus acidilactici TaxID=1254 RepID=UPI0023307F14|nr:GIY-YIG nuclease family protein [Pediococcus acidilactici]MDB8858637.1 GIY-YIG nuclease family protein [Pediococcus acidilactici]MDB8860927.1 GIY-YIG nuclease family protein [Pediococcus acidilactici]MDB8862181.1 GIY-YIG nuclease family protein [Pediococcus acidilactici]MDB8865817.1 GIY-YIG nuclease family protein [Pediococcus acidilactici]